MQLKSVARALVRRIASAVRPRDRSPKGHLDGVFGTVAAGWASVPGEPPVEVEILIGDAVVATATADRFRADVAAAGLGDGRSGFAIELPVRPRLRETLQVSARVKGRATVLNGSPAPYRIPGVLTDWTDRRDTLAAPLLNRFRRRIERETAGRRLSIVMPVYNTRDDWLRSAIDSVVGQWHPAWQLVCVDDGSTLPSVRETLERYARQDRRIKVVRLDRNGGIARATNRGIAESDGDYVAFLDHDDALEPDAVHHVLKAAGAGADLIYTDEILVGSELDALRAVVLRPAFSWDYYASHPYFVHFIAVRRELALAVGGWDESMRISADVDFVLRAIERARAVTHVPLPVYRWRTHSESAGHALLEEVTAATVGALNRHYQRLALPARASAGSGFNHYRTDHHDPGGRVAIVIPTRDKAELLSACIASIEAHGAADVRVVVVDNGSRETDALRLLADLSRRHVVLRDDRPFNYAALNNRAVAEAADGCGFVVFMNNDVEALEDGWIERLRSIAARPEVGIVGATLAYPDRSVQHAGVILGFEAAAGHAHQFRTLRNGAARDPGYNGSLVALRDYSAVTAACMMTRVAVFREVGGFDETLVVGFNDTDLCLRVRAAGYKVLNDGQTVLLHRESATRTGDEVRHPEDTRRFVERWGGLLADDPFYHPALARSGRDHELPERCPARLAYRTRPVELPRARQATSASASAARSTAPRASS